MRFLEHTFNSAVSDLAADEALLELSEGRPDGEILRIWRASETFVVAGYSNRDFEGVRLEVCRERGVPVFRRRSGGGVVVQASGCLNYALILNADARPETSGIRRTNAYVMERQRLALSTVIDAPVTVAGFTDLVVGGRKVSGNAQYRRGASILFHGAFLVGLDFALVEDLLDIPSVAPDYRRGRSHTDFLLNLDIATERIVEAMRRQWGAEDPIGEPGFLASVEAINRRLIPEYRDRSASALA